jgi:predicted phage baseplate assembly protein
MTALSICPCEGFVHPRLVVNAPGLRTIAYRAGDFLTFRHALLSARDVERQLTSWRPGAEGDLAVQLVEWWAYVADVLTFYNERAMSAALLRTAEENEDLRNLVRILGYRPRPAIAAKGVVAALVGGAKPVTLPAGLKLESKPGPGKQPQTFELDADTTVSPPGAIAVDPQPDGTFTTEKGLLLRGVIKSIVSGDALLLVPRQWDGITTNRAVVTVRTVTTEADPRGNRNTRITVDAAVAVTGNVSDFRLLRSAQSARPRPGTNAIKADTVFLSSLYRDIQIGMPLVIEHPTTPASIVRVSGYAEAVYYANGSDAELEKPPLLTSPETPPVPVLATVLTIANGPTGLTSAAEAAKAIVRFDWRDAAELVAQPQASIQGPSVVVIPAAGFGTLTATSLFIEDAGGAGALASATTQTAGLQLTGLDAAALFQAPLRLLTNIVPVSRGKTVPSEVLGSGDASLANQDFTLKKAPVTYLPAADSHSGELYGSTIRLYVDGLQWHEVPQLFGQAATARVFVTWEDAEGKTHVRTGDGITGARLPSGTDNVTATYRYGGGAAVPDAGSLTVIVDPWPGLKAFRNPVPVGGGSDPDAADRLSQLAPRSVLTFDRAVSAADFEVIAGAAPGVARVRSYWSFNADEQRERLTLYVGDDAAAVESARTAIDAAAESDDALVLLATAIDLDIKLKLLIDHDRLADDVEEAVRAALATFFSAAAMRIGAGIYRSAIHAACLAVPGVTAVKELTIERAGTLTAAFRLDPPQGGFFSLASDALHLGTEVASVR